tara:strand:- start:163 stop:456 length:294 start_codon:yes stop_codon:yes gene_type:complete
MPTKKDKKLEDQIDIIREHIVKDMFKYNRLIKQKEVAPHVVSMMLLMETIAFMKCFAPSPLHVAHMVTSLLSDYLFKERDEYEEHIFENLKTRKTKH